jgi:polyphosphate kinase
MLAELARVFTDVLRPELQRQRIHLLDWSGLDEKQRQAAAGYFLKEVFPILPPARGAARFGLLDLGCQGKIRSVLQSVE